MVVLCTNLREIFPMLCVNILIIRHLAENNIQEADDFRPCFIIPRMK